MQEIFALDNCLDDDDNSPCSYSPNVTDIGNAKYLYIMTKQKNALLVDEVFVDGQEADQFGGSAGFTTIQFSESDQNDHPDGCEVGIFNVIDDDTDAVTEPTCSTFPSSDSPTISPTTNAPSISPTTNAPTSASPSASPTTSQPSTSPTTNSPTTGSPSNSPTTTSPTTASPTGLLFFFVEYYDQISVICFC